MTLVLAVRTQAGILMAGGRLVTGADGVARSKNRKMFDLGRQGRFIVASYGGHVVDVPKEMDNFSVPASIDTRGAAERLRGHFLEPRDVTRNSMRMLVAGTDLRLLRVIEQHGTSEELRGPTGVVRQLLG